MRREEQEKKKNNSYTDLNRIGIHLFDCLDSMSTWHQKKKKKKKKGKKSHTGIFFSVV